MVFEPALGEYRGMSRWLIFLGGSFDPVHNGHLIVARNIVEQTGCDRLVLLPAAQSPHKSCLAASAADRLAMLRLALEGQETLQTDDLELRRPAPSYTFETLMELRRIHGPDARLSWVIGMDMLEDLHKWHRASDLVEQFELIVAARPGAEKDPTAVFERLTRFFSAEIVTRLRHQAVVNPLIDISSTDIRRRIADNRPVHYLLPPAVHKYIIDNRLYCRM